MDIDQIYEKMLDGIDAFSQILYGFADDITSFLEEVQKVLDEEV